VVKNDASCPAIACLTELGGRSGNKAASPSVALFKNTEPAIAKPTRIPKVYPCMMNEIEASVSVFGEIAWAMANPICTNAPSPAPIMMR